MLLLDGLMELPRAGCGMSQVVTPRPPYLRYLESLTSNCVWTSFFSTPLGEQTKLRCRCTIRQNPFSTSEEDPVVRTTSVECF